MKELPSDVFTCHKLIKELKREISMFKSQRSFDKAELISLRQTNQAQSNSVKMLIKMVNDQPPTKIPNHVAVWMGEYNEPWHMFYCYDHKTWFSELDNSFPWHMEDCICKFCLE